MDNIIGGMCDFCKINEKRYTCPRCHADYCSITCFQSSAHIECAEAFYQDCVLENLSNDGNNDAESQKKINDMFQRLRGEYESNCDEDLSDFIDSDDDDKCESLSKRLENVDLDDTKEVWKKLTHDERQEFEAFLRSGDVSKLIPKWKPWWCYDHNVKIQEVGEVPGYKLNSPKVLDDIAQFGLLSKPPSLCVQYNIVNIICAYSFTCRYFNGDYYDFLGEAVGCVVYLSLCLKENKNYSTFIEAVSSVEEECQKNDWITVDQENIDTMKSDVTIILDGPPIDTDYYKLSALSDLYKLLSTLLKEKHGQGNTFLQNCPKYKLPKKDVKLYLKKLEYLLSYVMYYKKNKANVK